MAFDAFSRELGTKQGRIAPTAVLPPQGAYVMCLGYEGGHRPEHLAPGDFAEVTQVAAWPTGTKLIAVTAQVAPPTTPLPADAGLRWVVQLLIDNVEFARHGFTGTDLRVRVRHLSANVSKLAATPTTHELKIRLLLENTATFPTTALTLENGGDTINAETDVALTTES
jgi:acyl dehydratase